MNETGRNQSEPGEVKYQCADVSAEVGLEESRKWPYNYFLFSPPHPSLTSHPGANPWDPDAHTTLWSSVPTSEFSGGSSWRKSGEDSKERRASFPIALAASGRVQTGARGEGAHALGPPSASHPLRPLLFPPLPPREKQPWTPGSPWHAVCEGQRTGCERGGQAGSGQLYWRWGHWRALSLEVREASAMGPWDPGAWAGKLRSWGAGRSSTGLEGASRVAEAR